MSHQTGIKANSALRKFFVESKDGEYRSFRVSITDEELVFSGAFKNPGGSAEDNYDNTVLPFLSDKTPCYIFFRLDSKNVSGYEWVMISWSPDEALVREKMLYASTKATLKKEFGGGQIKDEIFGNVQSDINLRGYKKHLESELAPQPLSSSEEVMLQIRKEEGPGVDTKQQTMQGVALPVSVDVINAFCDMKDDHITYMQMSIDMEKEEINLEKRLTIEVADLKDNIPSDHARYHLFRFPHFYEGDEYKSIVFIYSVPANNCPVKERMLYSSCKAPLLIAIEDKLGIEIAKKIEIDDTEELTEEYLVDQIHPTHNIYKPKFSKPKGPMNRGARRLVKNQTDSE